MSQNRLFLPSVVVDYLSATGAASLGEAELELSGGGSFAVVDAAHVVRETSERGDADELCGRVKSLCYLTELGAELREERMKIGERCYQVVLGYVILSRDSRWPLTSLTRLLPVPVAEARLAAHRSANPPKEV